MTQEQLREMFLKYVGIGTQSYISQQTGINPRILSEFKNGKIDLYPNLFQKLYKFFETEGAACLYKFTTGD